MIATTKTEARLAARHNLPDGSGYRAPVLYERLTSARARHAAHETLCRDANAKPQWLRDARSKDRTLPDDRQHEAIVKLIASGTLTDDTLIDYFGDLLAIYLPMIQRQRDADYLSVAREKSEAAHAGMVAHMHPTPENKRRAADEYCDDIVATTAYVKRTLGGSAA
jgi:hypothetical protein